MTTERNLTAQYAYALVETLVETGGGPSGYCYAAMSGVMDLDTYQRLIAALKQTKTITEKGHYLKPTKKAIDLVRAVKEARAKAAH